MLSKDIKTEIFYSKTLVLTKLFSRIFWIMVIGIFLYFFIKDYKSGEWPIFEMSMAVIFFLICPLIIIMEFAGYFKYLLSSNKKSFFKFDSKTMEVTPPCEKSEVFYYSEIKYFFLREEKHNKSDPDLYMVFYDGHGKKGILKKHFRHLYYKKYDLGIFQETNAELISIIKAHSGKRVFRKVFESKDSD